MSSGGRDEQTALNKTVTELDDRQIYTLCTEEQDTENTGRKPLDCVDVTTGYTTGGDRVTIDGVVISEGRDKRYIRVFTNSNTTGDYLPGDVTPTPRGHETIWQYHCVKELKKYFDL